MEVTHNALLQSKQEIEGEEGDGLQMEQAFTQEQKLVRALAAKFAAEVCAGEAEAVDRSHRFPMETWKKMASLGLLRLNHDERYGGVGFDPTMEVIVIEELSKAGLTYGAAYALLAHGFPTFVEKFGTQEQKQRYIPSILDGSRIGAFCLTESGAGSDAAGIVTTARRDGTDYLLNGTKQFVTAGSIADTYLVIALTNKAGEEKTYTAFLVDRCTEGVHIGKSEEKMGICGLPTTEVIFSDVRVPAENILGGESGIGQGLRFALATLDAARIGTGAQALGVAQAAYEHALRYATERIQFGKPISANQGIRWYLAEMATKLEIIRLLVYQAAEDSKTAGNVTKKAAMAKWIAASYGREVVNLAMQIYGGYGYMKDNPIECMYRDIRITEIYEGTSEIMKNIIAREVLPKRQGTKQGKK